MKNVTKAKSAALEAADWLESAPFSMHMNGEPEFLAARLRRENRQRVQIEKMCWRIRNGDAELRDLYDLMDSIHRSREKAK